MKKAPSDPTNAEFRDAYQSLRLFIRLKKRRKVPSALRIDPKLRSLHLDCRAEIREAIQYAYSSWTLQKWPDPIEHAAHRKLIRKRDAERRQSEQKNLKEIMRRAVIEPYGLNDDGTMSPSNGNNQ